MERTWQNALQRLDSYRIVRDILRHAAGDPSRTEMEGRFFSGLEVRTSELTRGFSAKNRASVGVWADILVVDTPGINAPGAFMMTRLLDFTELGGQPFPLRCPEKNEICVYQFFFGEAVGSGIFSVSPIDERYGKEIVLVEPMTVVTCTLQGKDFSVTKSVSSAAIADIAGRPLALNALQACFAGATRLMDAENAKALKDAVSMLGWIRRCVEAMGSDCPPEYGDLYIQAKGIAIALTGNRDARFVPVLSSSVYKRLVEGSLNLLDSFQKQLDALAAAEDIQKAVGEIGKTVEKTAALSVAPLEEESKALSFSLAELFDSIGALQKSFSAQTQAARRSLTALETAVANAKLKSYIEALFSVSMSVFDSAISVACLDAKDAGKAGALVKDVIDLSSRFYSMVGALTKEGYDDGLLQKAQQLVTAQIALTSTVYATRLLSMRAASADEKKAAGEIAAIAAKSESGADALDLVWDTFVIEAAKTLLDRDRFGAASSAASAYLADLKILARHGKALSSAIAAWTSRQAQSVLLASRIKAARETGMVWEGLRKKAQNDVERLASLQSLALSRRDRFSLNGCITKTHMRICFSRSRTCLSAWIWNRRRCGNP